jgi:hypothetical protein
LKAAILFLNQIKKSERFKELIYLEGGFDLTNDEEVMNKLKSEGINTSKLILFHML